MGSNREDRIYEIQQALATLPSDEWPSYLDSTCAQDPLLREEVLRRLRALAAGTGVGVPPAAGSPLFAVSPGSVTQHVTTFPDGTLLLDRFRIIRLLGIGGMGEVYEAEDLELRERVALKTIKLSHGDDARMMDRLRKEVQLGRRVTHPNVCRLFDVFRASISEAAAGRRDCALVTMQLLQGRTLDRWLKEHGALNLSEALPIAAQIAEGLQAAHDANVVHRDLKTANVFLVDEKGARRAVITDFGLATTAAGPVSDWPELSQAGAVVGTLAYMSPEQLNGAPTTTRSDLYAFGVVLYEIVSGQLPFRAGTPMAAAWKRLTEPPDDVRQHVPDLPPAWHDTIHRCLEREPSDRFASAREVAASLTATVPSRRRDVLRFVAACVAIALIWMATTYIRPGAELPPNPPGAVRQVRQSVALFGFRNVSGQSDVAYISTALDQGLGSELGSTGRLRMISGEEVARFKRELSLDATDTLAGDTLAKIRQNLGSDFIVLGSYTALGSRGGGQIRVDVRLQDTRTGDTVAAWSHTGTEAELLKLISENGTAVRSRLNVEDAAMVASTASGRPDVPTLAPGGGLLGPGGGGQVLPSSQALPSSPEGRRLYAEGLDALRGFDARAARDRFERAIAIEPDFAFAHVGLSMAWSVLGYDAQATREAAAAAELARGLRDEQRLWIDGLYRETAREWPRAITAYQQLVQQYPDEPEYVLRLADAQTSAGVPKEALTTISVAEKTLPATRTDPRFLIAKASAAEALGEADAQERDARAAIAEGQRRGETLLVARASISLGDALRARRDVEGARRANETARTLFEQAGDRRGVARALIQLGELDRGRGDLDSAQKLLATALEIGRNLGNRRQTMQALNGLGNVHFDAGRFARAADMYDEAVGVSREIGDRRAESLALGNLASVRYEQGNIVAALGLDERALGIVRTMGDRRSIAFALTNMGETAAALGKLADAHRMYDESRAINEALGDKGELSYSLSGLAMIALHRDDLPTARKLLEEAVALRHQAGDAAGAVAARVELGRVFLESSDAARARQEIEAIRGELSMAEPDTQANAAVVGALTSLTNGRAADARRELSGVLGRDREEFALAARVTMELAEAQLVAAEGGRDRALRLARGVLERARGRQLVAFALEAELAVLRIEGAGRDAFQRLAARAKDAGFLLVARKAASS